MPAASRPLRYALPIACGILIAACAERPRSPQPVAEAAVPTAAAPKTQHFEATAYTVEGKTASGDRTHPGIVAADPKVLPIGSRIRVTGAGQYSGEYEVADTGRSIKGNEIDIYIENGAEAKRFGRRDVQVEVLQRGEGAERAAQ